MYHARYGQDLIKQLEDDIATMQSAMANRLERINSGLTDLDDCFISQRCEERNINNNKEKINLIRNGGTAWFKEYATLDGVLVKAHWCNTKFGCSLRAEMPNGEVVWTTASTAKGLAKKGLKCVECLRPAWFAVRSPNNGMLGVYNGDYCLFPSDFNYATGEDASKDPIEIRDDV